MNNLIDKEDGAMDILELEKEIASAETDALEEERTYAGKVYKELDDQLIKINEQIPYPNVGPYDLGIDYEDIGRVKWEKSCNAPYWEKRDYQSKYCDNGRLYCGRLVLDTGYEYLIMESGLETRSLGEKSNITLINADDKDYANYVKAWRYPDHKGKVTLSRNISMKNRFVEDVEVVLDTSNEMYAEITDAYLRKALVRNRKSSNSDPATNMQSIIQTIQKKQDDIRSLRAGISFITQGCAGSGKTMVLLHRLRYLLFNKDIDSDEYVFLVPSLRFKKFIKNISIDFRISEKNIVPYKSYYQSLCGKTNDITDEDTDELVFDDEFLERIYSIDFISEAYRKLFEEFEKQLNSIIEYGEERLNEIITNEAEAIDADIARICDGTVAYIKDEISILANNLTNSVTNFESIPAVINEIHNIYDANKSMKEALVNDDAEIFIDPQDERILNNEELILLREQIATEEEAVKKANIFTARAHQNKLVKLKEQYDTQYAIIEQQLIEEERKENAKRAADLSYVFEGVTLESVGAVLEKIESVFEEASLKLQEANKQRDNINDFIAEKYSSGIEALNSIIDISSTVRENSTKYINELVPSYSYLVMIMKTGVELIKSLRDTTQEDEKKRESVKLFNERTDTQEYAYINTLLFNNCRKCIKEEFGINLCNQYKHYWYIQLYCQYLARPVANHKSAIIFIDEGQDLSKSEMELIYKMNTRATSDGQVYYPIVDIFGDVNQTITKHGISNWDDIDFISTRYLLDENFRNPNQIVDFCNEVLPYKMKKIGVDMEPVDHYQSIVEAEKSIKNKHHAVCIVKDEYAKKDLEIELNNMDIADANIYTVKEVKGLEFRETVVFNRDMTENESYIAYTRALVKLTVVDDLARYTSREEVLYIQGDEDIEVAEM